MESNFLQSQWVQRRGLFLAGTWRLNPKFKPATGRSLEYEVLRDITSCKPNRNRARPLIARFTCRDDWDRVWKARCRLKNSRISMGEDLPRHIQEIRKNVLIAAMKKIKQESPSHKATVVGDKLVVNEKVYFHYDVPTKWLPVNSPVNTQVDYGNGRVQPNNKNHCKVKKNTLMLWSNPKNCLVKARRWRFFCKSNPFIKL